MKAPLLNKYLFFSLYKIKSLAIVVISKVYNTK